MMFKGLRNVQTECPEDHVNIKISHSRFCDRCPHTDICLRRDASPVALSAKSRKLDALTSCNPNALSVPRARMQYNCTIPNLLVLKTPILDCSHSSQLLPAVREEELASHLPSILPMPEASTWNRVRVQGHGLGSPVVPFYPFSFWVPLLQPNSRKKGYPYC